VLVRAHADPGHPFHKGGGGSQASLNWIRLFVHLVWSCSTESTFPAPLFILLGIPGQSADLPFCPPFPVL